MNCEQIQERLVEFLLDELEQDEVRLEIERHLDEGCADCLRKERELRDEIDLLYSALPNERAGHQEVLEIAATVTKRARNDKVVPLDAFNQPSSARLLSSTNGLLSALSFAAGLLMMLVMSAPEKAQPDPVSSSSLLQDENEGRILLTSVKGEKTTVEIDGFMLYDRRLREAHFYAPSIVEPPSGHKYILTVGSARKSRAIDVERTSDGTGMAVLRDVSSDDLKAVSVEWDDVDDSQP